MYFTIESTRSYQSVTERIADAWISAMKLAVLKVPALRVNKRNRKDRFICTYEILRTRIKRSTPPDHDTNPTHRRTVTSMLISIIGITRNSAAYNVYRVIFDVGFPADLPRIYTYCQLVDSNHGFVTAGLMRLHNVASTLESIAPPSGNTVEPF